MSERVEAGEWLARAQAALAEGNDWFGLLTAVDDPAAGSIEVVLVVGRSGELPGLELRCALPRDAARMDSVAGVWAGAAWAERETAEMLGVEFLGHPDLRPLLLPPGIDVPPLRRDVGLARRIDTAWPGAHEPGEGERVRKRPTRALASEPTEVAL